MCSLGLCNCLHMCLKIKFNKKIHIVFRCLYAWCTRGTQLTIFNIVIVLYFRINSSTQCHIWRGFLNMDARMCLQCATSRKPNLIHGTFEGLLYCRWEHECRFQLRFWVNPHKSYNQYEWAIDVSNCYCEKSIIHTSHIWKASLQYECADDVSNCYCQKSIIHTSHIWNGSLQY